MTTAPLALLAALALSPAQAPDARPAPAADAFRPDPGWKPLGPDVWFDPAGRRLVVRARVALREGPLEHLVCLKGTKEHEAILATAAPARQIHAGLLLTGAETGQPVKFQPKFAPPTGTPVAITLQWEENGRTRTADARDWVQDERSKKALEKDWVFAGSELVDDPVSKKPYYLADDGDYITVANFPSAILDLPFASSADNVDRVFVARTEAVPPRGTPVTMFLQPRAALKGQAKPGARP